MSDNAITNRYPQKISDKILHKEVMVSATSEQVWEAWTTSEGARTFFSENAEIELRPGGKYEILFVKENPVGQQGSEGCRVLSYLPKKMLSYEWNAPPEFGPLRDQHTIMVLLFEEHRSGETTVSLNQLGWGRGEDWDKLYEYFNNAWGYVLKNLQQRFISGPIDWSE
jgi:uncharacterized protein YndB with AHSA1/START domain